MSLAMNGKKNMKKHKMAKKYKPKNVFEHGCVGNQVNFHTEITNTLTDNTRW